MPPEVVPEWSPRAPSDLLIKIHSCLASIRGLLCEDMPALNPENTGVAAVKADTEAGVPTLPVGYFSLGMDINSKPVFLLQLNSGFSPWLLEAGRIKYLFQNHPSVGPDILWPPIAH